MHNFSLLASYRTWSFFSRGLVFCKIVIMGANSECTTPALQPAIALEVLTSGSCEANGWQTIADEVSCRQAQPLEAQMQAVAWGGSGSWNWMPGGCVLARGQKKVFFNSNMHPGRSNTTCGLNGRACVCTRDGPAAQFDAPQLPTGVQCIATDERSSRLCSKQCVAWDAELAGRRSDDLCGAGSECRCGWRDAARQRQWACEPLPAPVEVVDVPTAAAAAVAAAVAPPPSITGLERRMASLAEYWLRPFASQGVPPLPQTLWPAERDIGLVEGGDPSHREGRLCFFVHVVQRRIYLQVPHVGARLMGLRVDRCGAAGEESRLMNVLRLLRLAIHRHALPDFQFHLCVDDFCHGYWEQRQAPLLTMASCLPFRTIPAVQWQTLPRRDPDFSVWGRTMQRRRLLREQTTRRWACREQAAVWRGSLLDWYAYGLAWSSNRTMKQSRFHAANWKQAGRMALAYQKCSHPSLFNVRMKLLNSKLGRDKSDFAHECSQTMSHDQPEHLTLAEQAARFRYVVNVEGNGGWADRLRQLLLSGMVVLQQDMPAREWFEPLLRPWEHYVPVSSTLHNLSAAVDWVRAHDAKARRMQAAAASVLEEVLSVRAMVMYQTEVFRRYSALWRGPRPLQPPTSALAAEVHCELNATAAPPDGPPAAQFVALDCVLIHASGRRGGSMQEVHHQKSSAS